MNHKAHVRFIYTHTEGDCRNNDVNWLHQEIVLRLRARLRIHSCVIGCGFYIVGAKHLSQFFYFLTTQAVNNPTLSFVVVDISDNVLIDVFCLWAYFVIEVGTVEAALKLLCVEDAQVFLYIKSDFIRSRSRECNDRGASYFIYDRANLPIFRAKIVSPFWNTMRLIYCIEGYLDRL